METLILFQRELANNVHCLFVFVAHPEVEPTNNRSERNARREAEIRKGAHTSKSDSGAKRRSIIVTVLASLQARIVRFTLSRVLAEVGRWMDGWMDTGKSLFEPELEAIQKKQRSAAGLRSIVWPEHYGQKNVWQKNGGYFSAHAFFCPERFRF